MGEKVQTLMVTENVAVATETKNVVAPVTTKSTILLDVNEISLNLLDNDGTKSVVMVLFSRYL